MSDQITEGIDKIVNIIWTTGDEVLGLGESGNVYVLNQPSNDIPKRNWKIIIESPKLGGK